MEDKFNTYFHYIDPDFWRELCVNEGKLLRFEKGEEFASVGHVARYFCYIKSGTIKMVAYGEDGTEHVVGMQSDGDFIADFPWSLYDRKARVTIVAVKSCDIYCFPVKKIKKRMDVDFEWRTRVMNITEAIHSTLYDRYLDLHCKTPQQRYDELLCKYPDLFSRFSLKDIASFLAITPTHLSRLKKNSKIQG